MRGGNIHTHSFTLPIKLSTLNKYFLCIGIDPNASPQWWLYLHFFFLNKRKQMWTRTFTPRKYKSHLSLSQIVCLILNAINLVKHFDPKTDHHTKFHQDPSIRSWVIVKTIFSHKCLYDLDLWPCDLDLESTSTSYQYQ